MPITLYELAAADPDLRFSPYCWRTRLALAHKGLDVEGVPWRFTEAEKLKFSGQRKVPVIVDGAKVVADSWAIAEYLEDAYPDRPSLFNGNRPHLRFINAWADTILLPGIGRMVVADIAALLAPVDAAYFRSTRERQFGMTLEQVVADREERRPAFRASLLPLRRLLGSQEWMGGAAPDYADFIVLGTLQWGHCVSRFQLLEEDDPVHAWWQRGRALFDGLAARAKAA